MHVCMYHVICFGMKMNVCMYYEIYFGVRNVWQPYFVRCTRYHDAAHQCRPQVRISRTKLASPESVYGSNRGGLRYSQPARYAPQPCWNNWRHETLRTSDINQSSLTPVNSKLDPIVTIRVGVKYVCLRVQRDTLRCENERSYVPWDMLWCEKWMFACTHTICFGVQNVCSQMLYNMIWYDKRLFACTTRMLWCEKWMFAYAIRYDLVCKCMFANAIQYDLVW